jgi:hypothetical protein
MKKHFARTFTLSAAATVFWLAASVANAQTAIPVFEYSFPASWSGTGTTVTDVSSGSNNGFTVASPALNLAVPPGAAAGTESLNTAAGAILTNATQLLANPTIAASGGFTMNISFLWNGTDSSSFGHTEKLIDYAGTESLQLVTTSGSASLQMAFADDSGNESVPVSTTILPNTWYNTTLTFGNTSLVGTGNQDVAGTANLVVNGTLVSSGTAIKGTEGDNLVRPIGVGQLGANFGYLVGFKGLIYDPSVQLGVVPEPSTLALCALGGLGMTILVRRRKSRC